MKKGTCTWSPPLPASTSDISPNPSPHLHDTGSGQGLQQRKTSYPELLLLPSLPLSLHLLHSPPPASVLLLPQDLPAKNLSGTHLHLTEIHWKQR